LTFGATIRRLGGTMVLAIVLAFLLIMVVVPQYFTVPLFVILSPTLFFGWPYLSRAVQSLKLPRAPTSSVPPPRDLKHPPSRPLLRSPFATVCKLGVAVFLLTLLPFAPLILCYWQAQRAHDTIRVDMTVPEVLQSATGWHVLSVVSHVPDPNDAGVFRNVHAVSFGNAGAGAYITRDLSTQQSRNISELEAITLFQEKLHESQGWHFQYTYIFMNQLVLFDVDFAPDGRVSRVSSLGHHW
jgi:hypothetical protein